MKRSRTMGLVVGLAWCIMPISYSKAVEIYQWTDDAGVAHFTDNPAAVPEKYRSNSARDIKPVESVKGAKGDGVQVTASSQGKQLWEQRCAACHDYDHWGWKDDKLGLFREIIDRQSKYPKAEEEIFRRFRKAANGRLSDMPAVEVSDEELKSIIHYLVSLF